MSDNEYVWELREEIERLRDANNRLYEKCDEIEHLRAKLAAAENVIEAARALQPGDNMDDLLQVLDEALRAYDAAKGADDE